METLLNELGIELTWSVPLVSSLILVVCMFIPITLERFYPYKRGLSFFRKGFWIDLVWYTFIQSFFLKILIFDMLIAPLKVSLGLSEFGYLSHWPIWALVLFFLITHDFYIYWFHRWQHSNKWLWRTHEAHHSVEQVDWLAGSRSHAGEILINQTIEFMPIFFLLDNETAAIVVPIKAMLDAIWGQFIHANIRIKMGPLGYVINGPELHLWHHADHPEVYHANFSTKLAIWDWVFGTAFRPDYEPRKYGVWYRFPRDWFMQHVFSIWRFRVADVEDRPGILSSWFKFRINLANGIYRGLPESMAKFLFPRGPLKHDEVYGPKVELADRN